MSDPPISDPKDSLLARVFGALDLVAALVVGIGVFAGLPSRWWVVDVPAGALVLGFGVAGLALLSRARTPQTERLARAISFVALALGLTLVAVLTFTASYLNGIYGPVGKGGAIILVLVAALALPYLIAFPASQLLWLGPRRRRAAAGREP